VAGVLAAAEGAKEQGLSRLFCAAASAPEAALAGIEPVPLHHLAEAASYLRGDWQPEPFDDAGELPAPEACPISPTSAVRSARVARSSSLRPGATTFYWRGRRARARQCSPAGCRGSCRR